MLKKMTIRGIGHIFEYVVIPYSIISLIVSYFLKPFFSYGKVPYIILVIVGIILIIIGIILNFLSMKKIIKAFKEGKLVSSGTFKFSRNPAYAAVILFLIPGFSFIFNSWLVLTSSVLAYILFKILIKNEEVYLEEKFGDEYRNYKKNVGQMFPKFFKINNIKN